MQVTGSFSKRIVVISGGGSAASDLPQMPNPPRPAAPANAALVRNRRRLCTIDMKDLPLSPYGSIAHPWRSGQFAAASTRWSTAPPCSKDHHTLATAGNPCESSRSSVVTPNGRSGELSHESSQDLAPRCQRWHNRSLSSRQKSGANVAFSPRADFRRTRKVGFCTRTHNDDQSMPLSLHIKLPNGSHHHLLRGSRGGKCPVPPADATGR